MKNKKSIHARKTAMSNNTITRVRKLTKHARKPLQNNTSAHHNIINWQSPEHRHHEKGTLWHIIAGLILALIIIYSIYDYDWTFIIALFTAIIAYYHFIYTKKPEKLNVEISDFGIRIGKQEYKYSQIRYFWIIDKPEVNTLNLRLKKHFMPDITIFLDGQNPEKIRSALKSKIPEIEKNESMTEALIRLLKI